MGNHPHDKRLPRLVSLTRPLITCLLLCISASAAQAERKVRDDTGQLVIMTAPAERIISLSPAITELVYAAGAGDKLIGIDTYSDYPPSAMHLPRIGSSGGLDRERLLQLQPDLVIAWASGNKATDLRWLQDSGIPVYRSEPAELDDIALNLLDIGVLAGTESTASVAAQVFRDTLPDGCTNTASNDYIPVFYEVWSKPTMTIGGQHWLNEVLQRAGMKNIFADQDRAILTLETEAALARPYQVKIIDPYLWNDSASPDATLIRGNPLLDRPGPRISEGIGQLCQQLD